MGGKQQREKSNFYESLEKLKSEFAKEDIFNAIERADFDFLVNNVNDLILKELTYDEKISLSIKVYEVLKKIYIKKINNVNDLKNYFSFTKGVSYEKKLKINIEKRINLIQKYQNLKTSDLEKSIIRICNEINSSLTPFKIIKRRNSEIFIESKTVPEIPNLEAILTMSVYRWRGDFNASELFSKLLRQFKSGEYCVIEFMKFLTKEFLKQNLDFISDIDYVVPVPADNSRFIDRGYDLADSIADSISVNYLIPKATPLSRYPSSVRSRDIGYKKLKEQFYIDSEEYLTDLTVLLVDDIVTKGNTLRVCTEYLLTMGVNYIKSFCLAKSETTKQTMKYI